MYDIFIKNYLNGDGSAIVSNETSVFSVPIAENMEDRVFIDPNVKTEMGKAGSMDFSLWPNNIYYDKLQQMRTIIRVEFHGTSLFRGRVLTVDNSYFSGSKKVHLEGDMAFLMDSQQPGVKEENRNSISILTHLTNVISEHNSQMLQNNEPDKTFELGEVPGKYSSAITAAQQISAADKKFGSDSWRRTMDELETLKKEYGGYFRTRFVSASQASDHKEHHYLDWLQAYFDPNVNTSQPIQVTSNMIDINSTTEVDNLFTVLIPLGDNNGEPLYIQEYTPSGGSKRTTRYISVPELLNFCTDSQLTRGYHIKSEYRDAIKQYGTIYKVQTFSNAKTQDVLWSYAIEWMLNNYVGGINNFTVRAIDLHHIDSDKQKYLTGDRVKVIYPDNGKAEEKTLTVLSVQYKLYNPDQNSYNVGIPSDLLSKEYGSNSKNKKSSKDSYKSNYNGDGPSDTDVYATVDEYKQMAYNYVVSKRYNGDIYDQLMQEDPVKAERALTSTVITVTEGFLASDARPTSGTHKKRLNTMLLDGITGSLSINGPIDHSHDFTDEEVDAINKNNRFMTIDAMKQEFGIKAVMDYFTPESLKKPTPTLLDLKIQSNKYGMIDIYGADKKDDPDAPKTASIDGYWGGLYAKVTKLGSNGLGLDEATTILQDGLLGSTKHYDRNGGISGNVKKLANEILPDGMKFWNTKTNNEEISATIASAAGKISSIISTLGQDGSGDDSKTTVVQDGTTGSSYWYDLAGGIAGNVKKKAAEMTSSLGGIFSLFNTKTNESSEAKTKTVEMNSSGTNGEGKISAGAKGDGTWRVKINEAITYQDASGTTHTLEPGFVSANDFHFDDDNTFNSLKTKILVADTIIAGKVTASEIRADLAYIRDLSSDTIKANRSVRAGAGYFTNGYITNMHAHNYFVSGEDSWTSGGNLLSCVNGADPISVDGNGKVTITLKRIGSGSDIVLTFNQAATTFYKNAVAAAWNNGGATAYFTASRTGNLDPGQSSTIYAYYKNSSGIAVRSEVSETGKYSTLQIKARSLRLRTPQGAVRPTTSNQTILPGNDSGGTAYDGLSQVVIEGSSNLMAGNIKSGVTIFGVTGTHEGGQARALYVAPDFSARYMDNYTFKSYTEKGGTLVDSVGGGATTGVNIPMIEAGAGATSPGLTEIPSGGITANGNYKFPSGYAGIRYLSVNVPGGSSGPTKHDAFAVNVTQGSSGTVVTIQKTYPHGSSCPFVTTSSKNFYWY